MDCLPDEFLDRILFKALRNASTRHNLFINTYRHLQRVCTRFHARLSAVANRRSMFDAAIGNLSANDVLAKYADKGMAKICDLLIDPIVSDRPAEATHRSSLALRLSAKRGHHQVVSVLLVRGAKAAARNFEALRSASENGHLRVVNVLIAHIGQTSELNVSDLISRAAGGGHLEIVQVLLSHCGHLNQSDGVAGLCKAAQSGHFEVCQALLTRLMSQDEQWL